MTRRDFCNVLQCLVTKKQITSCFRRSEQAIERLPEGQRFPICVTYCPLTFEWLFPPRFASRVSSLMRLVSDSVGRF